MKAKKKQDMQTFIRIEREWVGSGEKQKLPGTRLLVGEDGVHVIHMN